MKASKLIAGIAVAVFCVAGIALAVDRNYKVTDESNRDDVAYYEAICLDGGSVTVEVDQTSIRWTNDACPQSSQRRSSYGLRLHEALTQACGCN